MRHVSLPIHHRQPSQMGIWRAEPQPPDCGNDPDRIPPWASPEEWYPQPAVRHDFLDTRPSYWEDPPTPTSVLTAATEYTRGSYSASDTSDLADAIGSDGSVSPGLSAPIPSGAQSVRQKQHRAIYPAPFARRNIATVPASYGYASPTHHPNGCRVDRPSVNTQQPLITYGVLVPLPSQSAELRQYHQWCTTAANGYHPYHETADVHMGGTGPSHTGVMQQFPSGTLQTCTIQHEYRVGRDRRGDNFIEVNTAVGSERKRGRRTSALSEEKRRKAGDVRDLRACFRCRYYKENCDTGTECGKCKGKIHRKWRLGCVRVWPSDRLNFLQPSRLSSHLDYNNLIKYIKDNADTSRHSSLPSFKLRLTQRINEQPFELTVWEADTFNSDLVDRVGFRPWFLSEDLPVYSKWEMIAPPLIPRFLEDKEESAKIPAQLTRWLAALLENETVKTDWFPAHYLTGSDENRWQRDILVEICQYHQDGIKEHAELKEGLMLLVLNHFMTKPLVVEESNEAQLYGWMRNPTYHHMRPSQKPCSPKVVNYAVKHLMRQTVLDYAQKTLDNLQEHLLSHEESGWHKDIVFALSFIVMCMVGKNQVTTHTRAVKLNSSTDAWQPNEGVNLIKTMEHEFADHVIDLCSFKSQGSQKKKRRSTITNLNSPVEVHSRTFQLLNRVRQITRDNVCENNLSRTTELKDVINDEAFGAVNIQRLLVRFYSLVYGIEWDS